MCQQSQTTLLSMAIHSKNTGEQQAREDTACLYHAWGGTYSPLHTSYFTVPAMWSGVHLWWSDNSIPFAERYTWFNVCYMCVLQSTSEIQLNTLATNHDPLLVCYTCVLHSTSELVLMVFSPVAATWSALLEVWNCKVRPKQRIYSHILYNTCLYGFRLTCLHTLAHYASLMHACSTWFMYTMHGTQILPHNIRRTLQSLMHQACNTVHISRPDVKRWTYLLELLLQHIYLILHGIHLCLLQPSTTWDVDRWSKVKGCICCVVLPAFVQPYHLHECKQGANKRQGTKWQWKGQP